MSRLFEADTAEKVAHKAHDVQYQVADVGGDSSREGRRLERLFGHLSLPKARDLKGRSPACLFHNFDLAAAAGAASELT